MNKTVEITLVNPRGYHPSINNNQDDQGLNMNFAFVLLFSFVLNCSVDAAENNLPLST